MNDATTIEAGIATNVLQQTFMVQIVPSVAGTAACRGSRQDIGSRSPNPSSPIISHNVSECSHENTVALHGSRASPLAVTRRTSTRRDMFAHFMSRAHAAPAAPMYTKLMCLLVDVCKPTLARWPGAGTRCRMYVVARGSSRVFAPWGLI